jgi:hypothetical protein
MSTISAERCAVSFSVFGVRWEAGQGLLTLHQVAATGTNFSQFEARGANCNQLLERRATMKWGKLAPSLRVAAKNRPYFVVVLELGITKPCGLRLVWTVFRSQRRPPDVVLTGPKWATSWLTSNKAAQQSHILLGKAAYY